MTRRLVDWTRDLVEVDRRLGVAATELGDLYATLRRTLVAGEPGGKATIGWDRMISRMYSAIDALTEYIDMLLEQRWTLMQEHPQ